ncbi:1-deoxy-D-xylulose-5-phosphate synthase [Candidatus Magnetominusculus xianensis]|uniref:1-deoxy-D-xylulose-5-phosphate synthase n=1 Tax=Candidatus Magnetominusculus xianensis TaxID=1748249 RepID=A0ABR5SKR3_9BACT|nr:1-deoxy-D-xylulose-5-phosphate synthase [Candidatus Magnetominusculus xianensis]KWT92862.1 1-deoxy-D-xylulose-5-phosphate synthase [Candidatus Magnetominusculus xianensis]MBF0403451.1 1-deoxy-D-xylulose-5-phosphate synthase [Nitrospirota bacterium]
MRLKSIKSPQDIKQLDIFELEELAQEIRDCIINRVSVNGGHLASSLGVIELTLAMHYVFKSPHDKIVWDVGHQCYPHKLLTGRYDTFHTLRQYGGISGFPRRSESPHDAFGAGHSSTSISAALGIAEGRELTAKHFKVIAVIGDGAMTGGLAFEGLNNAGHLKKDLIVVLNDNKMSISKNVGALSSYLTKIMAGNLYNKLKKETKSIIETIPKVGGHFSKLAQKTEDTLKYFLLPGMLFEELGFSYTGPVDGHDIAKLIDTFECIKNSTAPILIHVVTTKGKGYEFSEKNPATFHGVGPFELDTGELRTCPQRPSFSSVFGQHLVEAAEKDPRIVAITAAMKEGTGLREFSVRFPERFYDVGIAEPHAVTFAAGMATQGLRPVVAVYSTFLQRAYDEIIHDVCLQNLPVVFAVDRAGIVGEDGPTHHGVYDISFLRHIPNLTIMSPKNSIEMKEMLKLALTLEGPSVVRYSRDCMDKEIEASTIPVKLGKAEVITEGGDVAILAVGSCVLPSIQAAHRLTEEGISAMVVNVRFIKPLDTALIAEIAGTVRKIVTVEENVLAGGFGSSVLEYLNSANDAAATDVEVKIVALPDRFIEHGKQPVLRHLYALDDDGIYHAAMSLLKQLKES